MSYRIYIGMVKKKELDYHLLMKFIVKKKDFDVQSDFLNNLREAELFEETPIEQFKKIKEYEKDEYPPYILTKNDFQKILNYYKQFLKEYFEKKEKTLNKIQNKEKVEIRKIAIINSHFHYLTNYFKRLIIQNKNIDTNGLFLLDYFYLVKMYDNWKNGDIAIITHG